MIKQTLQRNRLLAFTILVLMFAVFFVFIFSSCKNVQVTDNKTIDSEAVVISEDQQIIEVIVQGGYSPRKINAKAGMPTILRMKSDRAYGCERAFIIPELGISRILPENGNTEFDLGSRDEGTNLIGVCSMGMYYFEIFFN